MIAYKLDENQRPKRYVNSAASHRVSQQSSTRTWELLGERA